MTSLSIDSTFHRRQAVGGERLLRPSWQEDEHSLKIHPGLIEEEDHRLLSDRFHEPVQIHCHQANYVACVPQCSFPSKPATRQYCRYLRYDAVS